MKRKRLSGIFVLLSLLIAAFTFTAISPTHAQAASTKKKAIKAYKKMLSKRILKTKVDTTPKIKTKKLEFGTAYIDNNNVPELVVRRRDREGFYMEEDILVYTYYKGKVRQLTFWSDLRGIKDGDVIDEIDLDDENFFLKPRYYKKTGVFLSSQVGETHIYWKLSKGKVKKKAPYFSLEEGYEEEDVRYYNENGKSLSEVEFDNLVSKITKDKEASYFKFRKNTSKNRRKYLK